MPASPLNPVEDFPDIEMSFPDDTSQEEPHTEVNTLVGKVEEPLLIDQREENPDSSQKQRSCKSHNKIRKLKCENKLLKRRVKNIKVLKKKVGKLKEIIKELRKQLEKSDKIHERTKTKRHRAQGRNPLLRREVQTSYLGTQIELHIL